MNKLKIRWTEFANTRNGIVDAYIGPLYIGTARRDPGFLGTGKDWTASYGLVSNPLNTVISNLPTIEAAKALVELNAKNWFETIGLIIEWEA